MLGLPGNFLPSTAGRGRGHWPGRLPPPSTRPPESVSAGCRLHSSSRAGSAAPPGAWLRPKMRSPGCGADPRTGRGKEGRGGERRGGEGRGGEGAASKHPPPAPAPKMRPRPVVRRGRLPAAARGNQVHRRRDQQTLASRPPAGERAREPGKSASAAGTPFPRTGAPLRAPPGPTESGRANEEVGHRGGRKRAGCNVYRRAGRSESGRPDSRRADPAGPLPPRPELTKGRPPGPATPPGRALRPGTAAPRRG